MKLPFVLFEICTAIEAGKAKQKEEINYDEKK
jgi:hypothetical protein